MIKIGAKKQGRPTGSKNTQPWRWKSHETDEFVRNLNQEMTIGLLNHLYSQSDAKAGSQLRPGDYLYDLLNREWAMIKGISYNSEVRTDRVAWLHVSWVGILKYRAALRRFACTDYTFFVRREGE